MAPAVRKLSWYLVFVLLAAVLLTSAGCKDTQTVGASSLDDGQEIVINGLQDNEVRVTVGDLKQLPTVTQKTSAARSNGEKITVKATGPLLETLLQKYGKSQQDFSRIRFIAKDKYSIAVPADVLQKRSIILSYINDGQRLVDDDQPIRVVIPGERAMYWVRNLIRIDLETGEDNKPTTKVVFLETAARNLPQENYKYYDSVDKAIKIADLVSKYAEDSTVTNVWVKAGDGLQKNETAANFTSAYIKITGQEAPKFLAPDMPLGMTINGLLCFNYGATAVFAYAEGMNSLPKETVGDKTGIALSDIFKQTGLIGVSKYRFSTGGGERVELAATELGNGLIYENSKGDLAFRCTGLLGDKTVDDLLSIEAIQ